MKKSLNNETDWATEFGAYAVNRDTRIFENTSFTEGMFVEIFEDADENDVANKLGERLRDGLEYEYALYDGSHRLIGFAYYPVEKETETPKKVTRVFRFHAHTWADVIVEGDENTTDDEFFDMAQDKYNEGDYDYDDTAFENEDVEEITESLKEDNIYPFDK